MIKLRHFLVKAINIYSRVWHGYEIIGLENIPEAGPVLIVFYHAAFPADIMLFLFRIGFRKRPIWTVVDKFFEDIPKSKPFLNLFNLIPGNIDVCKKALDKGEALLVVPGGVFEALFSNNHYTVLWQKRTGFAKLIQNKHVKVVPVFTRNVREAWIVMTLFESFWKKLYNNTRLPLTPVYGGLPVKLTAVIGEPISISDCQTHEETKQRIQESLECHITRNQRRPGCVWKALLDRFY